MTKDREAPEKKVRKNIYTTAPFIPLKQLIAIACAKSCGNCNEWKIARIVGHGCLYGGIIESSIFNTYLKQIVIATIRAISHNSEGLYRRHR
jgi:hypothetical protein